MIICIYGYIFIKKFIKHMILMPKNACNLMRQINAVVENR